MVVKNMSWMVGERLVQMCVGFIISLISARYLGPTNYGVINYTLAFVTFFTSLSSLGLDGIIINRIVSESENQGKILGTALVMRLISSALSWISIILILFFLHPNEIVYVIVGALQGIRLIFASFEMLDMWFQSRLQSKIPAILRTITYFIVSGYKIYILATAKSVEWFAFSNSLDGIIISFLFYFAYKKNKGQAFEFDWSVGKSLLKMSSSFILAGLMVQIYAQTDKMMLGQLLSVESVGYYSIGSYLNNLFNFIPTAIIASLRPGIISAYSESHDRFVNKLEKMYSLVFWGCIVYALFITIFAPIMINFLYGEAYSPAIIPTQIIVWCGVWSQMGVARDVWIICEKKQKYSPFFALLGAITNVCLNFVLIPILGTSGAAIATIISQFVTGFVVTALFNDTRIHNRYIIDAVLLKWRHQ